MGGSKYILRVLCDYGHIDTALKLATKMGVPGRGAMVESGNSTRWESFSCESSDNHVFLGDIAAWAMNYLAGIR